MAFDSKNGAFSKVTECSGSDLPGRFAVSAAGHDAGRLYIIIGTEQGCSVLLVADGHKRGFASPKRKKAKHLRVLPLRDDNIAGLVSAGAKVDDSVIVHSLKSFKAMYAQHCC